MQIGYFLSCEEYTPAQLIEQAKLAEQAGFDALWISDHYHPWNDAQGQAPMVWPMIGAISQVCSLPIATAVNCPTVRMHPAITAQAAATAAVLTDGRFILGVGSGEALNEHVTGARWPSTDVRLEMLEEAVEVMRKLWTGEFVTHHGKHYTVEMARLYTVPDTPPPVYVSGFGPQAIELAGRIGDGFVTASPDAEGLQQFRSIAGDKPAQVGYKVAWSKDAAAAKEIAHHLWANSGVPGELAQILPSPRHFEQASTLVTPEMVAEGITCGDDPDAHEKAFAEFADAGFEEIFISQVGGAQAATDYRGFFDFYGETMLPRLKRA